MKIGLVLDDTLDKPDGVQSAVLDIGSELTQRGHEVHYLVTETKRNDLSNVHSLTRYFSLSFNGNSVRTPRPTSKKAIRQLLSELDLDILHIQMPYSPLMAGKVVSCAPKHVKVYGTFHILPYSKLTSVGTTLLGLMLRNNLRRFDGFIAVSKPAQTFMKQTFHVDSVVIPNPVNYQYYSSFTRQQKDRLQLVFVGRFDERKGVKQLLQAFHRLPDVTRKSVQLTMCGKGPLLDDMKQYSNDNKLGVIFPGFVSEDDKAQYLANSDIAVFPSISGESFGIVLAEAMSAGAGVTLGGNNPGYSSVLKDFPEALFDPLDIEEFTKTLLKFIDDEVLRNRIGMKQHAFVKNFDIKRVVATLLKEYKK